MGILVPTKVDAGIDVPTLEKTIVGESGGPSRANDSVQTAPAENLKKTNIALDEVCILLFYSIHVDSICLFSLFIGGD